MIKSIICIRLNYMRHCSICNYRELNHWLKFYLAFEMESKRSCMIWTEIHNFTSCGCLDLCTTWNALLTLILNRNFLMTFCEIECRRLIVSAGIYHTSFLTYSTNNSENRLMRLRNKFQLNLNQKYVHKMKK